MTRGNDERDIMNRQEVIEKLRLMAEYDYGIRVHLKVMLEQGWLLEEAMLNIILCQKSSINLLQSELTLAIAEKRGGY